MSKNRTSKLVVELLEDRTLMSASGLIANPDGPISTFKNAPVTIDVLVNDINQNGGTLSIVNLTQDPKGIATVNPDNTVTFSPFTDMVGSVALGYVVTNGQDTAAASIYIDIFKSPSDLYFDYQAAVSQADQVFASSLTGAFSSYQGSSGSILTAAQTNAEQLYGIYVSSFATATQDYLTAHAELITALSNALNQADTAATGQLNTWYTAYGNALTSAQNTLDAAFQSADSTYLQALDAATSVYQDFLAPYESALNSAKAYAAANPQDSEAQTAYAQAQLDYANAETSAHVIFFTTSTDALEVAKAAEAAAMSAYCTSVNSAWQLADSQVAGTEQFLFGAYGDAFAAVLNSENAAQQAFITAESAAWDAYESGINSINTQVQSDLGGLQSQFASSVDSAFTIWANSEQSAWDTYSTSLSALPGSPAPQQRQYAPSGYVVSVDTRATEVALLSAVQTPAPQFFVQTTTGQGTSPSDPFRFPPVPPGTRIDGIIIGRWYQFGNGPVYQAVAGPNGGVTWQTQAPPVITGQRTTPQTQWQPVPPPQNPPPVVRPTQPQPPPVTLLPPEPLPPPVVQGRPLAQAIQDLADRLASLNAQRQSLDIQILLADTQILLAQQVLAGIPADNRADQIAQQTVIDIARANRTRFRQQRTQVDRDIDVTIIALRLLDPTQQ